ncbi:ribonuclease domain-containing protein [Thiospirillum jenense]|uniref:Uncharacterized protein n=1 Tax=Thiospirillum jenense TaxID=1653858 RepID=A0A839HDL8_9GAMM|nr:ribonuclease domain-containing protein [Thiospirillum jenense]MBB1125109.1 hypothetical protein [Thiospirillum jenense]
MITNTLLKLIAVIVIFFVVNFAYAFTSLADDTVKAVAALSKQIKYSKNLELLDKSQQLLLQQIGRHVDDYLSLLGRYNQEDRLAILLAVAEQKGIVKKTEKLYLYRAVLKGKIEELHLINLLRIEKITKNSLPAEGVKTLDLIKKNGPFPYGKDGTAFNNREKKLPIRENSIYYQEYTVKTPGRLDRGARRIVIGKNGEIYYTEDHYQTFKAVTE